ncbi:MAG: TRAP transporter large permease [Pseudomonadota bacterium]
MSPFEIGLISLAAMAGLVMAGLFVPVALMLCSYVGVWAIKGSPLLAGKLLALAANDALSSYFFGVVPLFVLMGFITAEAGLGRDAFQVANHVFRRIQGGLGLATIGANAAFAAVTGISIASAAVFARLAVPEMTSRGYTAKFATGIVAGSSVLGMLIPPSLLLILYALLTEQSVGDLFLAGVLPGLLLAVLFGGVVLGLAAFAPRFVGLGALEGALGPEDELTGWEILTKGLPLVLLIVLTLGGIYGGLFTPIEAGAVGALGATLIGLAKRRLTLGAFWRVLTETGLVTAAICFLLIAAQMYSRMLALSGVPAGFGAWVATADLAPMLLVLAYCALVIALGAILDSSSIMLILVPLMLPVAIGLELDLIWFGVVTVIAVEIGLLTPPFGISVFVVKSTLAGRAPPLGDIFAGAAPFAAAMLVALGLVLAFPWLATALL